MVNCRYCAEDLGCEPWLMAWGEPAHKRCYDKAVENVPAQVPAHTQRQGVVAKRKNNSVRLPGVRRAG